MVGFISANLEFEGNGLAAKLLKPFFFSTFFTPVSLNSIYMSNDGDHWFLSGFATEDYVLPLLSRENQSPNSVEIAADLNTAEYDYLLKVSDCIYSKRSSLSRLSPFELEDLNFGLTFFKHPVKLDINVLSKARQWTNKFPKAILHLYGYINLTTKESEELPFHRAYGFSHSPEQENQATSIRDLFVIIRAGSSLFSHKKTQVTISGYSDVWLQESQIFNRLASKQEADKRLEDLIFLFKAASQAEASKLLSVNLDIDQTRAFLKESERIERAFSNIMSK